MPFVNYWTLDCIIKSQCTVLFSLYIAFNSRAKKLIPMINPLKNKDIEINYLSKIH